MKRLFITVALTLSIANLCFAQVKLDTLYYDENWKRVEHEIFASYYRIISASDDEPFPKRFKDFYITGELRAVGKYRRLDKYDDLLSVFHGEYTSYYSSGQILEKMTWFNGIPEGEYTLYYIDGSYGIHAYYKNGKLDGIYTELTQDRDAYIQMEYKNGKLIHDYYILSNKEGYKSKVRFSDDQPIYESPLVEEKGTDYKNGDTWSYYNKNGIIIGMTNNEVYDYGNYYQLPIIIANHSMFPIDFDPNNITANLIDKKGKEHELKVLSADEYMKKVDGAQGLIAFLAGFSQGLASTTAGYSTSTETSTSSGITSNTGTATISAYSYDSDGYSTNMDAYGDYSGNTTYYDTKTSTTKTYDSNQASKEITEAKRRTTELYDTLESDRREKSSEYLKRTILYPGDVISGYINIKRKKGSMMTVYININEAIYEFPWNLKKR